MNDNLNYGFESAYWDSLDVVVLMTSNSYIPEDRRERLKKHCEHLLLSGADIGWLYRGNYLAGELFQPSKRLPYILNLERWPSATITFAPDGAKTEDGRRWKPEYGDFGRMENYSVVDAGLELSLSELEEKLNWVRCYADLMPKRKATFEWEYWRNYYMGRCAAAGGRKRSWSGSGWS